MKVMLASYAQPDIIPVWGTSNYILHIPKTGTSRRVTVTPTVGGGSCGGSATNANELYVPRPNSINVDNIRANVAKGLAGKLKNRGVRGRGIAVI